MTAAAVTGPARHPRPASSQPASALPASQYGFNAWCFMLQIYAECLDYPAYAPQFLFVIEKMFFRYNKKINKPKACQI
jgi:hypothetical protein